MLFKKESSRNGMHMSVQVLNNVTYKKLINYFGEPDDKAFYKDDTQYSGVWLLSLFGTKIEITMDSSDWTMDNWEKKSYKVPDVREKFVNSAKILGDREFVKNIVIPLLQHVLNNKNDNIKPIVGYVFEKY